MSFPGRINLYRCADCRGFMITVDSAHPGDTTYFTRCQLTVSIVAEPGVRRIKKCGGGAKSSLYEVSQSMKPGFEWYMPRREDWHTLDAADRCKVENGLLLLRPLEPA